MTGTCIINDVAHSSMEGFDIPDAHFEINLAYSVGERTCGGLALLVLQLIFSSFFPRFSAVIAGH